MSFYDERTYQQKAVLEKMIQDGLSVKQIANSLHISYKLVNLWLVNHGLATRTPEMKFP
jgi:DNA-binding NarL/FixJ family response regulator